MIFSAIDLFGNDDHLDNYVFTFQERPATRTATRSDSDPTASQQPQVAASPPQIGGNWIVKQRGGKRGRATPAIAG